MSVERDDSYKLQESQLSAISKIQKQVKNMHISDYFRGNHLKVR